MNAPTPALLKVMRGLAEKGDAQAAVALALADIGETSSGGADDHQLDPSAPRAPAASENFIRQEL